MGGKTRLIDDAHRVARGRPSYGLDDRHGRNVLTAVRLVAAELGNTPAICRASYVHPIVIARYVDDGLTIQPDRLRPTRRHDRWAHAPEERALIRFLDEHFPERRRVRRARTPPVERRRV